MERFVIQQNIEHYRAILKITTDPAERRRIENLLREKKPNSKNMMRVTKRIRHANPVPAHLETSHRISGRPARPFRVKLGLRRCPS